MEQAVQIFSLGVKPDLTFYLDVLANVGLSRLEKKDRIESRPLAFHHKLRRGFLKLSQKYPRRLKVIDASGSLESIYKQIEMILKVYVG